MKVMLLGGEAWTVIKFRRSLIADMQKQGHSVTVCAQNADENILSYLKENEVDFVASPLDRSGMNPVTDYLRFRKLCRIMKDQKPDLVLCYFAKPVIYGLLAAALAGVKQRYALIEGLGYAFTSGNSFRRRLSFSIVKFLYKFSLRFAALVFFLNPDDRDFFIRKGLVRNAGQTKRIKGIGVELDEFTVAPLPAKKTIFIMIARLLRDKGVLEYCRAAALVKAKHDNAEFRLLGPIDSNPAALTLGDLAPWTNNGTVLYLGKTDDVRDYLAESSVFVLPSYREGLPRSTMEAMAMGRAVITTDAPGCRETVIRGRNGFIVPTGNHEALASRMEEFLNNPDLLKEMGAQSRQLAEEQFDVHKINTDILGTMGLLSYKA